MSGGYDTASTVGEAWDSASSNGYGDPSFWMRYFSPCYTTPFNVSSANANDECISIWDIGAPFLSPITVPTQSRLGITGSSGTAEGQADGQAFCSALETAYVDVGPLSLPTNNNLWVWLDQENGTSLSTEYWNAWATYVGEFNFTGTDDEPLYPCLYCTPDAAQPNCSTVQNPDGWGAEAIWSSEWQECSNSLADPPAWNAQACSEISTILWQFCDGTGICNESLVDQDLNASGWNVADYSFFIVAQP
jgi:hypothetical protein